MPRTIQLPNEIELVIAEDLNLEDDAAAVVWDAALVLVNYLARCHQGERQGVFMSHAMRAFTAAVPMSMHLS